MFEKESSRKINSLKTTSIIVVFCASLVVLCSWIFVVHPLVQVLKTSTAHLSQGSSQVASASAQVAQSSQTLAEGSNDQASSLEEVSASLEEITSMAQHNTESLDAVQQLAKSASQNAQDGGESMGRMLQAVTNIENSSNKTAGIVKTIQEIAFQTNLLALNAAVEAARAGDAGKGFAVVADEVRNLAQRAAEAARSTEVLIKDSVDYARNGVELQAEVAKILEEMTAGTQKVSILASEVRAAGVQQLKGVEQVNQAVAQMNTVTQANAAGSEEGAAAAEELGAQSNEMTTLVKRLAQLVGSHERV